MKKGMKKFEAEQSVNCSTTQIENQTKEICEGTLSGVYDIGHNA